MTMLGFSHAFLLVNADSAVADENAIMKATRILQVTYRMGMLGDFEASDFEQIPPSYFVFLACTFVLTVVFTNVHAA